MGQSKIATAKPNGTWQAQDGTTFHKIEVSLEDGTQGGCLAKTPDRWNAGDEVEYEDRGNGKLKLSKPNSGGGNFNGGGGGRKMDPKTEWRITFLSALSSASTFLAEKPNSGSEDVVKVAKYFTKIAMAGDEAPVQPQAKTEVVGGAEDDGLPF
jgi:hypothetical protein